MKLLITGSTGFIGRHLIPELLSEGHEIMELTRNIEKSKINFAERTSKFELNGNQNELNSSIREFDPEGCIHLASFLTPNDDFCTTQTLIESNIIFLTNVLEALKECRLDFFINTGTFAEYYKGNDELDPAYLYAATKTASRYFIKYFSKLSGFRYYTVIPYTIYGGGDSKKKIIDFLFDSINQEKPIDLSLGEQVLDFIHISDVVSFYSSLLNNNKTIDSSTVFFLGTGKGHNLRQVASLIEEISGSETNVNWGGKNYRKSDVMKAVAKLGKSHDDIGWKPKVELKHGIRLCFLNRKINNG